MSKALNSGLYRATREAILSGGGNEWIAEEAAMIIASDTPDPDLGRTETDRKIIDLALPYVLTAVEKNHKS